MEADADAAVAAFDALPPHEATPILEACCGSTAWVHGMVARGPFTTVPVLLEAAERLWWSLAPDDWREAFDHHPRIGETAAAISQPETARRWSANEQRGVAMTSADVRQALADGNRAYERRFGHIYLVFATGKSAEEMLTLLHARLRNDPDTELRVAAGEQMKITRLRLTKMLSGDTPEASAT